MSGITVSTYLPPSTAALLSKRASAGERSVAAEIRLALRAHLNDERRPSEASVSQASGLGPDHAEG